MRWILVLSLGVGFVACDRGPTSPEQFLIRVDSLTAPAQASYAEPFTVTFYGRIGGNTCYSLRRVEREYSPVAVDFTFVGERCVSGGGYAVVVSLNQPELIQVSRLGPFAIRVHQPDGSTLTRNLTVH